MSNPTAAVREAAAAPAPEAIVEAYVATWNETDPARRRAGIAAAWAEAGTYRDPVMASDGPAGIDTMLAGVQAKFPGFVLKRTSRVDAHNGTCRFTWSLGPAAGPSVVEGVDFCALAPDGRLASVVGFIDKMPG
ncbi:MAG: nuclear transport factor 2 family protein [Reyranella sp.]|nr:nuclear transport factor 2 family protein [Reyranella sp.]